MPLPTAFSSLFSTKKKGLDHNSFTKQEASYAAVPDDAESDTTMETPMSHHVQHRGKMGSLSRFAIAANVVLFIASVFALLHAYTHDVHRRDGDDHINEALKKVSLHSMISLSMQLDREDAIDKVSGPLLDRLEVSLTDRMSYAQYGDSLKIMLGEPGIWRKPPSPEVDAAWTRITPEHIWPVTREDIVRMLKDPEVVPKLPPQYGPDAYVGKALAFHHIHCLNSLRKAIHKDYYWPDGNPDPLFELHTGHCTQALLEHLMCLPDPGIYLYRWMGEYPVPVADTNIWSKCWDFDGLLELYSEMAITNITENDLEKPANVPTVPVPAFIADTLENAEKNESGKKESGKNGSGNY